jgi:hypothetical protein
MMSAVRHLILAVVLVACWIPAGRAQTAFVQSARVSQFSSGVTNTVSFTANVTAGNLIAVAIAWTSADTLVSVTDNLGNGYELVQNPTTLGTYGRAAGAYAKNIAGGACTVTVTFSPGAFSSRTIIVHEISGADPFSPLDASAGRGQMDPGPGVDAVRSGAIATTADGDYIFGMTADQGHASTLFPGAQFTSREQFMFPVGVHSVDYIQPSAGPIEATFTNATSLFADFVTLIMAFKPVESADTIPPEVAITGPVSGETASGTLTLSATGSDDVGLAGVQFKVDGTALGPESLTPPYSTSWNSAAVANGTHTITAVARDRAGNTTTSAAVSIEVSNLGSSQAIIGAQRMIEWSQAGVPGGIPKRTAICADLYPGVTATEISDAIAACSNGVVYLNAGTYVLSSGISFGGRSHVTLRGAGPDRTTLVFTGSVPCGGVPANICVHGTSTIWSGEVPAANVRQWTAGHAKGATHLTLNSTNGLERGSILVLDQRDDVADTGGVMVSDGPGFSIEGGAPGRPDRTQQQFVRVIAIDGNEIAVSPAIHMPNWRASQQPQAWWWGGPAATVVMNGVEDLTVDHGAAPETSGIKFSNAYLGWVKNVKSLNARRNHVWLYQAARIEVRDSYFYGTKNAASQSYGVELFTTSDDLVINNIFQRVTAPVMTGTSAGSVIAYNFMTDMYYFIPTWMMAGLQGSHDAGTGMNLFEGNVGNSFLMDLYHGTGNLATLFRNHLTGTEPGKLGNTIPISIWGYNRLVNIVGNVLGTPGYHVVYENSSVATPGIPDRSIYVLGYVGVGETVLPGLTYDSLVASTLLRWGNYDYATYTTHWNAGEIPAGSAVPSGQTLPASLFLFSKPGWWGGTPWPAIGPDVLGGQDPAGHVHKIPAQSCYDNSPKDGNGILVYNANNCYVTVVPQ